MNETLGKSLKAHELLAVGDTQTLQKVLKELQAIQQFTSNTFMLETKQQNSRLFSEEFLNEIDRTLVKNSIQRATKSFPKTILGFSNGSFDIFSDGNIETYRVETILDSMTVKQMIRILLKDNQDPRKINRIKVVIPFFNSSLRNCKKIP